MSEIEMLSGYGEMTIEEFDQFVKISGFSVVYFWSPSCDYCKGNCLNLINDFSRDFKNIDFYLINTDKNDSLKERYDIRSVPTMLFMVNNKITKKFVGGKQSRGDLLKKIQETLKI